MNVMNRFAVLAGLAVVLIGCKSDKKEPAAWHDPFFPPDSVTPASKTMFNTQIANGAAEDAMLFDIHFHGEGLNSLGAQKLDAMVKGKAPTVPLKVYLNMSKDEAGNAARLTTVEKALETAGVVKDQYAVTFGPNPKVLMPADAGIRALQPAPTVGAAAGGTSTSAAPTE